MKSAVIFIIIGIILLALSRGGRGRRSGSKAAPFEEGNKKAPRQTPSELAEKEKQGFKELLQITMPEHEQAEMLEFINSMKDYHGDEVYLTNLNYVMEHFEDNDINFLMALDWKAAVEELDARIKDTCKSNFKIDFHGPKLSDFPEKTAVYSDGVFVAYDSALQKYGLKLGFIDTQSDEYVIFIHRLEHTQKAIDAVAKLGYRYFSAGD